MKRVEAVKWLDTFRLNTYPKNICKNSTNEYPDMFLQKNYTNKYSTIFVSKDWHEWMFKHIRIPEIDTNKYG